MGRSTNKAVLFLAFVLCAIGIASYFLSSRTPASEKQAPEKRSFTPAPDGGSAVGKTLPQPPVLKIKPYRNLASNTPLPPMTSEEIKAAEAADAKQIEKVLAARSNLNSRISTLASQAQLRFRQNDRKYAFISQMAAFPQSEFSKSNNFEIVANSGGYVFVQLPAGTTDLPSGARPVVVSDPQQNLGALTGGFTLKVVNPEQGAELAKEFNLEYVNSIESLQMVFLKSPVSDAAVLVNALESLRKDSRVLSADLEVKERLYVPQ